MSQLSYGQRVKIRFLQLMVSAYDLLIMDEPTNHLDIETRESLEVTTADETPLLGLNHTNNSPRLLDMSMDWSVVSEASLQGWLTRLLAELQSSQYVKRIES